MKFSFCSQQFAGCCPQAVRAACCGSHSGRKGQTAVCRYNDTSDTNCVKKGLFGFIVLFIFVACIVSVGLTMLLQLSWNSLRDRAGSNSQVLLYL